METGIHFAGTILKFTAKSYVAQCAPQTTPIFVVSAFVYLRTNYGRSLA